MKYFTQYIVLGAAILTTSCSDFLNTIPKDALSPETTWKTETDAQKFVTGCYDGWEDGGRILYMDCASDYGYNHFVWEGYKDFANGNISPTNPGTNFYDYAIIRRCNTFLENIDAVPFGDEKKKKDLIAQVRVIRAYRYFLMLNMYGGVPIIKNFETADEAQVPRNTEEEVRNFIETELDQCTPDLNPASEERGRIAQGAALALRMREALYHEDWTTAKAKAQAIIDLKQYDLEKDYTRIFQVSGQDSKEIILSVQYIPSTKPLSVIGQMYNNAESGWSSIVPTYNLVDAYEMKNGKTIDEPGSGYDPVHPFKDRDPRLGMSILYPGANYTKSDGTQGIFNTLDQEIDGQKNGNYMNAADASSKTGLTWSKYLEPLTQYTDIWASNACPVVFRYAEVLLTWAEAENELNGPSEEVYGKINEIRLRAGMPEVDEEKYATKETLRELIHRERSVEFAGEGIRRADILRWKTEDGKMLAEKVLNGSIVRRIGTVGTGDNPEERATITQNPPASEVTIENRVFKPYHRYFPISQEIIDKNPKLKQNEGY